MKTLLLNTLILLLFFNISHSQYLHDYVTIFESIPENDEEYVNIFGDEPNLEDKKAFEKGYFESINGESLKGKGLAELKSLIVTHKAKPSYNSCFIIIGHNYQGFLKFANGETLAIVELEKLFEGVRTVFLSCNSNKFLSNTKNIGVKYPIQIGDAISISNKINKFLYVEKCVNTWRDDSEVNDEIKKIIKKHRFNKSTVKSLKISASVIFTGGIIYIYSQYNKANETSKNTE